MRIPAAAQPNADELPDPAGTASPSTDDSGSGLSIGDILHMLGRHKLFIVICALLGAALTLGYVLTATPIYEASASLRIDPQRAGSLGLSDLVSGGAGDASDLISTEIAILKSDAVAIATLDSLSDAEFKQVTGMDRSSVHLTQKATTLTRAEEGLLGSVKGSINAKQVEGTQLVSVSYRSPSPQVAAMMVNHVMTAYLHQNVESRTDSVEQVSRWLSGQMDALRNRAADAQRRLANFQEQNNILGDAANNTTLDRLRSLNARLAEAEADRIVKEAQMRAAQTGNLAVLSSMITNPALGALQSQQGTLYAEYAQLSTKFGPGYPPLGELKQQMQAIDAEVQHQLESIRQRLQQEYNAAATTEKMLQGDYDQQTEKAYALNREQAQYAVLQAEGTSTRDLYDTLQYKLEQAGVDAGLSGVSTMIVDTARAPLIPVEPKKATIVTFGVILGLFAGLAVAFFKEAVADSVQNGEQVERLLGLPLLAAIPQFKPPPRVKGASQDPGLASSVIRNANLVAWNAPLSRDAEAYRALRNSVLLSSLNRPFKSILISSALAGEGKSTTAANYAIVLAQHGIRVLLLDADLRRPRLHLQFGVSNVEGLSDLILGNDIASPLLTPLPDLPNLHLLPAGTKVTMPSEALASLRFRQLIAEWEAAYDVVLIDSAPVLVVSDTLPVASFVDALILVTRYNKTPVRFLRRLRDVLKRANAHVVGAVINEISDEGASYGGYGYGYSEYYK